MDSIKQIADINIINEFFVSYGNLNLFEFSCSLIFSFFLDPLIKFSIIFLLNDDIFNILFEQKD